jgi:hypothetical protein
MTIILKNAGFDLFYTLTPAQIAATITSYPEGVFYLSNNTDGLNLGNNTIVQTDYANINVLNVGNLLSFPNRFVSLGDKELQISFYVGFNSGNFAFPISDVILYKSRLLTSPYSQNEYQGQWTVVEKTSNFDLVYTLTPSQIAATITAFPEGIYFLRSNTDGINLGNNTIVQTDYANINVLNVGNLLSFPNRFVSLGVKELQVSFYVGFNSGNFAFPISEILLHQSNVLPRPPRPPIPPTPTPRRFTLQFTNNAMVYYKPHSLSIGGGSVRNARHKKRKT